MPLPKEYYTKNSVPAKGNSACQHSWTFHPLPIVQFSNDHVEYAWG